MRKIGGVIGAALLLVGAGGEPIQTERATHYYDIEGRTVRDLREAMDELGPPGKDGTRYDGYTSWYVSWRYRYARQGGTCRLTRLDVSLKLDVTLPRWRKPARPDPALADRFRQYVAALSEHERGHEDIGRRVAREVEGLREDVEPERTCADLEAEIERQAQAAVAAGQREDLAYDRETDHGATQGARFP